jgi:hypothetical protein
MFVIYNVIKFLMERKAILIILLSKAICKSNIMKVITYYKVKLKK